MGKMKILVACEESQAVTVELRKLGHEAFSCDIIECSGGHPEWHIMDDVLRFRHAHILPMLECVILQEKVQAKNTKQIGCESVMKRWSLF